MEIRPPVVQLALDFATVGEALSSAAIGVRAGVDWLEVGTPLILAEGASAIGKVKRAFAEFPVLADYKSMDSGGKNVHLTKREGGQVMTVCGGAPDETIRAAVAAGRETGVGVVVDLIGVRDPASRARECVAWGVDMIYLHYGADQRRADASRDSVERLGEVLEAASIPVGVGTFGVEDAVRAVERGASLVAIGHPLISGEDPLGDLTDYVRRVRSAWRPARG